MTKKIITYGTFDLLHVGHVRLLKRAKLLGDHLTVGLSTDEFNSLKGKSSIYSYAEREEILSSLSMVDEVIPEESWEQKINDIKNLGISIFAMGDDWNGTFDHLAKHTELVYIPRTENISTSEVRTVVSKLEEEKIKNLKHTIAKASKILEKL
ncbi:adenylyltransferase/cytidyltransferase family protein [Chromohalobacter israelensis]|uniref:adenylyltransferase/cytidyltransferase family protein n=1 Tax=Chromohalobacter israelensis TaxID=141390 RepID=UPI000FFECBF7|nr:adenylyltransferase/cytidyltransferase family protein [Chromohalobacter salexigens]RXE46001.1 glycerol-3-phosphate cytidylyltransferase [Chromohalobacter salexigens]